MQLFHAVGANAPLHAPLPPSPPPYPIPTQTRLTRSPYFLFFTLQALVHTYLRPQWSYQDVEAATLQLFHAVVVNSALHSGADKRGALRDVLALWAAAHPSDR
jgi:hypothetical protein